MTNRWISNIQTTLIGAGILIVVSGIFLIGWLDWTGRVTADSIYYLSVARSISTEGSFFIHGAHQSWYPPLYGILSGAVAWLTPINAFWSSKVVNAFCFLVIGLLLLKLAPQQNPLILLALFPATLITVTLYSLAETLFIMLLVLNVWAMVQYMDRPKLSFAALMAFTAFLMFMTRYIGVFILPMNMLFITWVWFQKDLDKSFPNLIKPALLLVFSAACMVSYLVFNYTQTGMITGPRYPAQESWLAYIYQLIRVAGDDINLLMVNGHRNLYLWGATLGIQFAAVFFFIWKSGSLKGLVKSWPPAALLLIATGLWYLFVLVGIRSQTYLLDLHYRYTSPGIVLIFTGLLIRWLQSSSSKKNLYRFLAIGLMLISVSVSVILPLWMNLRAGYQSYPEYRDEVLEYHSDLPENSVLLWGNPLLSYESSSYLTQHPWWTRHHEGETWDHFAERMQRTYPDHQFFLLAGTDVSEGFFQHPSVVQAVNLHNQLIPYHDRFIPVMWDISENYEDD